MENEECLLVPPEEFSGEQKRRDQGQRSMENALWPPLKRFLMNRNWGGWPPRRWSGPDRMVYHCELHMVRGLVRVRIRRCAMCATRGTSGFFRKNVNKDGSKDQWRVLILPAVMAGFGTGRYTMCDLDLSRLRDYPGQDTAYSLRIIT